MLHDSMIPRYPELYAKARTKVKKRVARWPSAYASGQLVQVYTQSVKEVYGPRAKPYLGKTAPLSQWFRERWVDISTGMPCGSVKTGEYYPVCRPQRIARSLKPKNIANAVAIKQKMKEKTASYPSYFRKNKTSLK